MRIMIVSPAEPGSRTGNRTTTLRWARILRGLGHAVRLGRAWDGRPCDLLVALHALKSHLSVLDYRRSNPTAPLVVALGGTDLYRDLLRRGQARRSLEMADRLIILQVLAARALPRWARRKVRVIHQSVDASCEGRAGDPAEGGSRGAGASHGAPVPGLSRARSRARRASFTVTVVGHLRPLKDPFRAAMASRRLPSDSNIRVVQVGRSLTPAMEVRVQREEATNPRYRSYGDLPRARAIEVMARSQLMVISSRMEGGANVLGEAITLGVPVLASRIDGNVGLLGERYPGYFECGDTHGLARLMLRAEREPAFLRRLGHACARRRPLFSPERERAAWRSLLRELR